MFIWIKLSGWSKEMRTDWRTLWSVAICHILKCVSKWPTHTECFLTSSASSKHYLVFHSSIHTHTHSKLSAVCFTLHLQHCNSHSHTNKHNGGNEGSMFCQRPLLVFIHGLDSVRLWSLSLGDPTRFLSKSYNLLGHGSKWAESG